MNAQVPEEVETPREKFALQISNVAVTLGGRQILHSIDLAFADGVVALVGPNGSGKSTLLRAIATVQPTESGSLRIGGREPLRRRDSVGYRRLVGFLPQRPSFPRDFTVVEAIRYAVWVRDVPRSTRDERVRETMQQLDLLPHAQARLGSLSGGTLQRVYIGQTIVHSPSVILLDEPTTGVDAAHRHSLRELLRELAKDRLLILSTHLSEDVGLLATRVVSLREGSVDFDGTPQELMKLGDRTAAETPSRIDRALRSLGEGN